MSVAVAVRPASLRTHAKFRNAVDLGEVGDKQNRLVARSARKPSRGVFPVGRHHICLAQRSASEGPAPQRRPRQRNDGRILCRVGGVVMAELDPFCAGGRVFPGRGVTASSCQKQKRRMRYTTCCSTAVLYTTRLTYKNLVRQDAALSGKEGQWPYSGRMNRQGMPTYSARFVGPRSLSPPPS